MCGVCTSVEPIAERWGALWSSLVMTMMLGGCAAA